MLPNLERDREVLNLDENGQSRFWGNATIRGEYDCWPWKGKLYNGYGRFYAKRRLIGSHRAAFLLKKGELAADELVDHVCRNRACVNPAHLRAASPKVNALENSACFSAVNASKTHCKRGHELSGWNLIQRKDGRECRKCKNERWAAWKRRRANEQG